METKNEITERKADKVRYALVGEMKVAQSGEGSKTVATERQITFVASDATADREDEVVEIATFRLPTKSGGLVRVADLTPDNQYDIDIPLLTDHDGFSVDKVIGSVRKAEFQDGKLIFTAGISSRKYAQDLLLLLTEGHLHNAFSIGWRGGDFDPRTASFRGGEIIEVSLVTRGCNRDASLLAVDEIDNENRISSKGKEKDMNDDEKAKQAEAETPQETADEAKTAEAETETPQADEPQAEAEADKGDAGGEKENGAAETSQPSIKQERKVMTTHQKIAVSQIEAPSQKVTTASNAKAYLDTPEATHDFAKFIVENYGKSNAAVLKAWADKMHEKGITGDTILPTTIEQTFFKVWQNESGILAYLKPSRLLQGSTYAITTKSRAFGHKKGEKKDDVGFETIRRDYKAKIAYARMPIDLQDLIDDTTGELTLLRSELLADLLYTEIARAVVIGDGREETDAEFESHDHRLFDGTRGIFSMVSDLDDSTKSGTQKEKYAAAVATQIANDTSDEPFDKALKVLSALRGTGERILVAPTGFLLGCQLDHDNNRNYKFQPGSDFSKLLNAKIFEFDWMTEAKYDLIAFNAGAYLFPTGTDMLRTAFDTEYNTDILLHEKPVTGTLYGRKVCAGYAQAGDV